MGKLFKNSLVFASFFFLLMLISCASTTQKGSSDQGKKAGPTITLLPVAYKGGHLPPKDVPLSLAILRQAESALEAKGYSVDFPEKEQTWLTKNSDPISSDPSVVLEQATSGTGTLVLIQVDSFTGLGENERFDISSKGGVSVQARARLISRAKGEELWLGQGRGEDEKVRTQLNLFYPRLNYVCNQLAENLFSSFPGDIQ